MKISEAIQILHSAYKMFGDVAVTFQPPETPGAKAKLELKNVDTSKVNGSSGAQEADDDPLTDVDLFIDPGPNRWSRS